MTTETNNDFYVFLPKTDFPMRGDLPQKEPAILKNWADEKLYEEIRQVSKGKPKWVLHWGPPYANGRAHMGHAFTKSLKDIVNRCKQMQGYDAPLVPGWDCHGLPIEWKIEEQYREKGLDKDDVPVPKFRAECREFAQKWADIQSADFQRLGVFGDFKNPYMTMAKHSESVIAREIHKFVTNGLLYRGVKPVMWSVVEKTALAEAEVEYKDHKSITIWVKFPVVKAAHQKLNGAKIVIWTTTPWTMPSNRGIAAGENIKYGIFKHGDEKLVVALSLAEAVKEAAKIESWTLEAELTGADIIGTICAHPLRGKGYEFDVPVLKGDFVTEDAGTGFVHIAPSHGEDDFYLGKAAGLEITDNVADDGTFREHVPLFAGLAVYNQKGEMDQGNFAPIKAIEEAGNLLAKASVRHEYPHSWRSKAPIIYRTTPQWFVALDKKIAGQNATLRETALQAIKDTKWYPASGENRISAMIAGRGDWCLSRQRVWGVPIALFVDKKTGEVLNDQSVFDRIVKAFEEDGADAWWQRPAQEFLGAEYQAENYHQIFDTADVWFDSASTHAFVCDERPDLKWPADLYLEGSDQHRGWFHSSLLESCATRGRAPYESVLTHGFVLDEKGYKMSKSLGNVVDPNDVLKQYGADILRLWTVTSDYSEDVRIGKDTLKNAADLYRRIRNTFRFLLGALEGFTEDEKIAVSEFSKMPELEKLVLHWMAEMDGNIRTAIDAHDYNSMIQKLHHFCSVDLSAFYFDIRKDRLYCDRPDSFDRRACRTVLYHLFESLVTWFAPILCFTAEEAWGYRPASLYPDVKSVHLVTFPTIPADWKNDALSAKWDKIRDVRRVILGALEPKRADKTIGSSLEAHPQIFVDAEIAKLLNGIDMAEVAITSQVTIVTESAPAGAFALGDVAGVGVVFELAKGNKCERCWKILPDVGSDSEYPTLSKRDADAVRYYQSVKKAA
ncbi:MAG: isoleucine--tRNA ligase [Alphaproteobacteria bacterium RIFCSPHIGHO2_02_FULL_46_13]|nr:MAG: isoleucine--tRNA ligase [Alphaproteobacteria bacterium RIFCSPHIGHO2_02_FULL_46_13]